MSANGHRVIDALLTTLMRVIDGYAGRYRERTGARTLDAYLADRDRTDDEETITEPVLAELLERVLGFPKDGYFPQLSKSGSKPDFTPTDLVAHPFVLDAKSSLIIDLDAHEPQIRRYIDQRGLSYGVLFNLRELRVYRRGASGHEPDLSFLVQPLWQVAHGEALPGAEVERFASFVEQCSHHALDVSQRIARVAQAESWRQREARGEPLVIDIEYLVDKLRALSRLMAEDAATRQEQLDRALRFHPELEAELAAELRTLALDLQPGTGDAELPRDVAGFRAGAGLAARTWKQYLLRVSQLALTRIFLYRSWEDAEFVDERLYDGGFGQLYERLGKNLGAVLEEAFAAGRSRYPWLYGGGTTYDWYRPGDDALVEVLYSLLPVPLGKLDADVLGGLYESYVDEIDRDRLGQFYTPRAVIRFMFDRAGLTARDGGLFAISGDERRPRRVLDIATGSGGFLVEAARRIVDEVEDGTPADVEDGLAAIVGGLSGSEISPFPYYLTEVNLLLQVSRLLGRLRQHAVLAPRELTLGVVHADTLATRPGPDESLAGMQSGEDRRFGLMPLDPAKAAAYKRVAHDGAYDFVVGNPPYVFESGNRILFERLRSLPGWRDTYRGKSDYLYYFLLLASERLRSGGRLAVITPAGWLNAGEAEWLRERIASVLRLDEMFLFGSYRVFAPELEDARDPRRAQSPTVESLILIATKAPAPAQHQVRVTVLEDERAAARALHPDTELRTPDRAALLQEMSRRADADRGGRRGGILVHGVRQATLEHAAPWPVKFSARDLATRVVAFLDRELASPDSGVEPLKVRWEITRGIESGADAYTARIQKRLAQQTIDALSAAGRLVGERILELQPGRERELPWRDVPQLLARSVEPHAILYGALDEDDYTSLIWIGGGDEVPKPVQDALEPWRAVLATRAEFVRNARRRWFETAWPRDKDALRQPKVIALYRTDRGRFAVDESGDWQPSNKTTLCTAREHGLSVAYLCGLLNSELLDLWYALRGKTPRDVWRNYEPKPMARIPYRQVDLATAPGAEAAAVRAAGSDAMASACDALLAAPRGASDLAHALVALVRAIAGNRRALLPHRAAFPALTATVKDPWRTQLPQPDLAALAAALRVEETVSVRLDPTLTLEVASDGTLGRPVRTAEALEFRHARRLTASVRGDSERLDLLGEVVPRSRALLGSELATFAIPKDGPAFRRRADDAAASVAALLDDGRELVERAERIVCRLYGAPTEMEDDVVAHAVERARRPERGDE